MLPFYRVISSMEKQGDNNRARVEGVDEKIDRAIASPVAICSPVQTIGR